MPRYGTWIRARRLYWVMFLTALCLLAALSGVWWPAAWLMLVPAALFGFIAVVVGLTRYRLSSRGGGYQERIHELIAARVGEGAGRVLDVGCGSGSLTIRIAQDAPGSTVLGVDSWADDWEYSQSQCESNAVEEGVADRVRFQRGDAAHLPFGVGEFDTVVSCLTFHEVRSLPDRADAVREALRLVRPGGQFVFLDLFADPTHFTSPEHVHGVVRDSGCVVEVDEPLSRLMHLPFPLGGAKVLGHARLLMGRRIHPA